jgi:hypothetical protein
MFSWKPTPTFRTFPLEKYLVYDIYILSYFIANLSAKGNFSLFHYSFLFSTPYSHSLLRKSSSCYCVLFTIAVLCYFDVNGPCDGHCAFLLTQPMTQGSTLFQMIYKSNIGHLVYNSV